MMLQTHLLPYLEAGRYEAGCDEAGRGCLSGPVFAAAVILPSDFFHPWLNDSKKLTEKRREQLRPILETEAIAWSVAEVSPEEIDAINILQASFTAMHRAIDGLRIRPDHLLIDGNRFRPYLREGCQIPHSCHVHGDARFASIAAASVLAKTYRDERMRALASEYPAYHWDVNKGYPTKDHRQAIAQYGPTPHHRLSFKLLPDPTLF